MMSQLCRYVVSRRAPALLLLMFGSPAAAEISQLQNVSFTAGGKNPWAAGNALEIGPQTYSLICSPGTPNCAFPVEPFSVNLPPINAGLDGFVTGLLEEFLDVSIPSIASVKLNGVAQVNQLAVQFGYSASAGRLNINYPAQSKLSFAPGELVLANQDYTIDSEFRPGVYNAFGNPTAYDIDVPILIPTAGNGYGENPLGIWSASRHDDPKFSTTAPNAEAWLYVGGDARIGAKLEASALGGLFKASTHATIGGPFGGRIVEVDPSGLYAAGEKIVDLGLTESHSFSIPGGQATVQFPWIHTDSDPLPGGSRALQGEYEQSVLTITGDLEKLIPFVGPLLQNELFGFLGYNLAHVSAGPDIRAYQKLEFAPDPKVRLTFSEPVIVEGYSEPTTIAEFPLDQQRSWTPMFSNSSQITVVPEYILDNTFTNETGVRVGVQVEVDALSVTLPGVGSIGPLYNPDPFFFQIGDDIPIYNPDPFSIDLPTIVGGPIVIPKLNIGIHPGFGDLNLDQLTYVGGDPNGVITYDLHFSQAVDGGPPKEYHVLGVTGNSTTVFYDPPEGGDDLSYAHFEPFSDVIVTDTDTGAQFNLGRNFCLGDCDLSAFLPIVSPFFDAIEDPDNPGQFLPNIYLPYLAEIPDTDVDIESHPFLGQNNSLDPAYLVDEELLERKVDPTTVIDHRDAAANTNLAGTGEFVPDSAARVVNLYFAPVINDVGVAAFNATLEDFVDGPAAGLYSTDGSQLSKIAREADQLSGGDSSVGPLSETTIHSLNDSGQSVFRTNSGFILRGESAGTLTEIAHVGEPIPDGPGTFTSLVEGEINAAGQVVFSATLTDTPNAASEGVYVGNGASTIEIVRVFETLPGLAASINRIDNFSLNDVGQVAFQAERVPLTGTRGIWRGDGDTTTLIAIANSAVPGGGTFKQFGAPHLNNSGQVAFEAELNAVPIDGNPARGIYRSDGSALVQIARVGDQAPENDGYLKNVYAPVLNAVNDVAFIGLVQSAVLEYVRIYKGDGGPLSQIAHDGEIVPNGNGVLSLGTTPGVAFNDEGHTAFVAHVAATAGGTDGRGLFLHDGTGLFEIARVGDVRAGSTISELEFATQYSAGLNNEMQVAYRAVLADGRHLIERFDPSLYWKSPGSGDWDTDANWSLGFSPGSRTTCLSSAKTNYR